MDNAKTNVNGHHSKLYTQIRFYMKSNNMGNFYWRENVSLDCGILQKLKNWFNSQKERGTISACLFKESGDHLLSHNMRNHVFGKIMQYGEFSKSILIQQYGEFLLKRNCFTGLTVWFFALFCFKMPKNNRFWSSSSDNFFVLSFIEVFGVYFHNLVSNPLTFASEGQNLGLSVLKHSKLGKKGSNCLR